MQKMYMISLLQPTPTYRIGEVEWNGIRAISMVQEPHASKWQRNAAQFSADVSSCFLRRHGSSAYHEIIVADARDGMEYPMITTLDGGKDPSYRGLLAHEIGHQWFYAMVGTRDLSSRFGRRVYTIFNCMGFEQNRWRIPWLQNQV